MPERETLHLLVRYCEPRKGQSAPCTGDKKSLASGYPDIAARWDTVKKQQQQPAAGRAKAATPAK